MKKRLQVNRGILFIGIFMAVTSSGQGFDYTETNDLSDLNEVELQKIPENTEYEKRTTHILRGDMNYNNCSNINCLQEKLNGGKSEIDINSDYKTLEAENKIDEQEKYKGENLFTTQYSNGTVFNVETGYRDGNVNTANTFKVSSQSQANNLKLINKCENVTGISKSGIIFGRLDNASVTNTSTNLTNEQFIGLEYDKPMEIENATFCSNNSDSSIILQAFNISNETIALSNEALKINHQYNYKPTKIKLFFPPRKNSRFDNKSYLHRIKCRFYQTSNIKPFENHMNVVNQIYVIKPLMPNETSLKYTNKSLGRVLQLEPRIVYGDFVPDSHPKRKNPCGDPHRDKLRSIMNTVIVTLIASTVLMALIFLCLFCVKIHSNLSRRFVNLLNLPLPQFCPDQEDGTTQQNYPIKLSSKGRKAIAI